MPKIQDRQQIDEKEIARLYEKLQHVGFTEAMCRYFAPLTSAINRLKKEKNAVILAHSYQSPDIIHGVADFTGDSYQLSRAAQNTTATTILFSGVVFMAETAKILNPQKTVIVPSRQAGCSLSDSITAEDVRVLRTQHPHAGVVCYVNTSAAVKAECDVCCTSANALKIVEAMPQNEIIFLPDAFMAKNLSKLTKKKIIPWHGKCIVHEQFNSASISRIRQNNPGVKVLSHTECAPEVVALSDLAGGTGDMIRYVRDKEAPSYMLVTECGLSDRMRMDFPRKKFIGMCTLCPYMKKNTLPLIRDALAHPTPEQIITIPEPVRVRAEKALQQMFAIGA